LQGTESISPDDIALQTGTIGYEILTGLDTSVDRVYVLDGTVAAVEKGIIY
jgi:alanine racemase